MNVLKTKTTDQIMTNIVGLVGNAIDINDEQYKKWKEEEWVSKESLLEFLADYWDALVKDKQIEMAGAVAVIKGAVGWDKHGRE